MKSVNEMFEQYLELVELKKENLSNEQLTEVKRAFYGACGILLDTYISELLEGKAFDVKTLNQEVEYFWLSEAEKHES